MTPIDGIVVSQMAERRRAATVDVQTQDGGIHALLAYCHTRPIGDSLRISS